MKNVIIILLIAIFASACAPTEEVIQNAISQTQAAEISPTMTQPADLPTQLPAETRPCRQHGLPNLPAK